MDKLPELERLSESEKDALITALWAAIQRLPTRVAELEAIRKLSLPTREILRTMGALFAEKGVRTHANRKAGTKALSFGSDGRTVVARRLKAANDISWWIPWVY